MSDALYHDNAKSRQLTGGLCGHDQQSVFTSSEASLKPFPGVMVDSHSSMVQTSVRSIAHVTTLKTPRLSGDSK